MEISDTWIGKARCCKYLTNVMLNQRNESQGITVFFSAIYMKHPEQVHPEKTEYRPTIASNWTEGQHFGGERDKNVLEAASKDG